MPDPVKPTGPVATDPLNPSVTIPVYLGGDGPVHTPEAGDRGDTVGTPATPSTPAAAKPTAESGNDSAAEGSSQEARANAEDKEDSSAVAAPKPGEQEPSDQVTQPDPEPPARNEKGQFIPRSRFNEVNEERKRLAQELAQLKSEKEAGEQAAEEKYDFVAKEKEYANLVLDGKIDEAIALRQEIRAAERADYIKEAQKTTLETTQQLTVKERIGQITAKYEQALPQFDPESEHYSEDLLNDVRDIYAGALQGGRYADPAAAFQASIDKALKLHGINMPSGAPAPTAAAAPATAAPPARTAEKRVQAIVNQPPSLNNLGTSGAPETHATIDIKTLSDADFAKLPEATRRRMRGDEV